MNVQNLANNQIVIDGQTTLDVKYYNYSRTTTKYLSRFLGGVCKKEIKKGIKEGVYLLDNLND